MEIEKSFIEIKSLIDNARSDALKSVNTGLSRFTGISEHFKSKVFRCAMGRK